MVKKTVKYTDFNGEEKVEDHYFHLTQAELTEINFAAADIEKRLTTLMATGRRADIIDWFKNILIKSYGIRSEDGSRFVKSDEVRDSFIYSNAFSELFVELLSDPKVAKDFIEGVMGKKGTPVQPKVIDVHAATSAEPC